jgi:redox-sensitive bicupin YhaK (pirin superfamily)
VLDEGDVQIIRAGNGIEHSEQLEKGAVIFQIWTDPNLDKTLSQPCASAMAGKRCPPVPPAIRTNVLIRRGLAPGHGRREAPSRAAPPAACA